GGGGFASLALAQQRAADEVVGVTRPPVLGISGAEGLQSRDRLVVLAGFPEVKALRVGVLAGIAGGCRVRGRHRWGRAALGLGGAPGSPRAPGGRDAARASAADAGRAQRLA